MVKIFKKESDENGNHSFILVEELQDDLALAQRLMDLRADGGEYHAEIKENAFIRILEE
jgi:hypothetical protein